jgi:pre-mRNA-processing factor 6
MSRLDFLRQKAPDNYVAGIGRGATGFTTRSDIGPAREGPSEAALKAALERKIRATVEGGLDDEEAFKKQKMRQGLFANEWRDYEDDEADKIYDAVEAKLDRRRQAAKMERLRKEQDEFKKRIRRCKSNLRM